MDSTFLAMLSGAPSLLQSYNQDAQNSKQDTYVSKIAIDGNDIHVNAIGNEMSKNFSELLPNIATNGSLSSSSFPKVLSAACCSSNSSYREGAQTRTLNYHSSNMTGSLTNHLIRADGKVINLLMSESGCTGQANNGKIHLLNTQISEKLPFEANLQSVHRPSAASLDGFPRVSCFGTSGNLLFSKPGILGVVCSCHCLHMSVSMFCEHSGLISHNPGHAVHMASGETIGQWRELYFKAIGLRVPDDQDGWDWPEGFPTAAGFINSSFISSEMQKNANISHLVSSHRVSTKPLEHLDNANLPNDLNLAMAFVIDGYQNKLHKSDHGSHIFVKECAPSLFNCHTLQDNQVTCVTDSRSSTMSKFIAAGPNNGIEDSSCYTSSTTKGGHLSVPDSTLQTSKNNGIGFDLRKVGMARDSASVDRKVVSSHIKLKLGQPCQQTWAFGNSAQPIKEPTQSFSKVATPLKPVTSVDATESKELGKYFQPYAGSSFLKRKEMPLKNHPYGMNTAAEAKQATIGTDISKASAVLSVPFSQAIPEANIHIGAFDNRINGSIGTEKPQSYSSTINYDSINDPLIFGCNLEKQPSISNMSFHRAFDKGVGSHSSMEIPCISCIWGAPRTVVDGKNYCLQEKILVHESGHKRQSVSGNTSKSMDFESAPWSQPPLLGTSSYVLDKILDLSKQDKNSHFPVDNVRIPLVRQVSKLQQQAISDVRGCVCQQPSSPSNFRIQCSPVKPQITANMEHCQFPCGQQQSEAGFKPVEIGARNGICRGPLNEQTKMQSQYPLDLHQNERTLAREKEVLVSEFEECTPKLPSADCFANWRGTTGTDWFLGGSVVGTERISQGQLVMEGREDFRFKSICYNNLDSLKEIAEPMASNAMLEGKITGNGLCHSAQWKDAPEKGERRNNLSLLDHTGFLQDRREDNGMQLDDTCAERIHGSIEVSHACGEEDGSNLSAGCSSTAVTQTSVGIKKMSSPLDTQNIGGLNDLPGDEGSVIGDCSSSYDASESRRSSKFKEIGHGSKSRRMTCRFMGSNLHHGLLDELKTINSLTWKKGQKCVHKEHFHLERAKCSEMLEQSSKKGRKRKMKVVNSPSLSAIGNSRDSGLSTHSLGFTGVGKGNITGDYSAKWCSSSDGKAPGACNDCFHKVSSKGCGSFISSSKSLPRKRSLQQLYIDTGESQKKMKWMKDGERYCDDLVNTGLKKSGRKHLSDQTCELTHADTSVLSAASAWQMKVHWPWMRPVASGLFGEISPGEPDPDMMKPAKIVCLSKILETSRRCKVPKDTQSFISGLNKNTLENYVAIDMQSDTLNGENQNTYNVGGDCTFKHKGLDAETERVCSQQDKSTKRYRRGPGICSDIHSSSKSKRVRIRSLNELSLQENKREIVKNPDSRSCVEEKCENTTNKCYVEPLFGSHKGAMACVEKIEFTCARTEGYKGRKRDGSWHDIHNCPNGKIRSLVPQDQLNAWIYITGQKSCVKSTIKLSRLDVESDHRKEYARYKQARGWKHLVVYKSSIHALGLYTSRFIYHGEMVVEYIGEIVGQRVADKREKEYQSGKRVQYKSACYFFRIDKEHIIDATQRGGIARFVNHSCQPNCVAKVISLKNEKKVVFFAERDIFPGEEITYDYHFNHEDEGKKIPCYCNAKNCRRYMN